MRLGPKPEVDEMPGQFWIDFIRDTAPVFRKPTIEQLGEFIAPTWQCAHRRREVRRRRASPRSSTSSHPTSSSRTTSSASRRSGRVGPAVGPHRVVQPRRDEGSAVAPFSSGYPAADRGDWPAFLDEVERTHRDLWEEFDAFSREHGDTGSELTSRRPRPHLHEIPWLNLYRYPAEADYARASARSPPTWHRLDSTVRAAETTWALPEPLASRDWRAGLPVARRSLGSADVGLMQRLVDLLATTEHRVIVSKGPLADQISPPRQPGRRGVPAAARDPARGRPRHHPRRQQHRHRGVPPREADDRAAAVLGPGRQRPAVDETGFGRRLATYDFDDTELAAAVDGCARGRRGRSGAWRRSRPG